MFIERKVGSLTKIVKKKFKKLGMNLQRLFEDPMESDEEISRDEQIWLQAFMYSCR